MKKIFTVVVLAMMISACGERIKPDNVADDAAANADQQTAGQQQGGAQAGAISDGAVGVSALEGGKVVSYEAGAINDANNVLSERMIYFGFDSNNVGDDYVELVKHHGKYLSFNPQAKVVLEGHADERGSREYNIALAERRAQAVEKIMLFEGAGKEQISIVSYGEEKPVALGHDEESMSLNRRVEIVYE